VARLYLPAPLPWQFPQPLYRSDARLIFALRPNQRAFTADKPATINARGLRGPLIPFERNAGTFRILLLGDSIAFGYGVAESETVAARLAIRLDHRGLATEVINAGVPSYNVEQEVAYLAAEGTGYQPDWVVLGVCWNDINEKSGVRVTPEGWLATAREVESAPLVGLFESPGGYALRNMIKSSRLLYATTQGWQGARDALWPNDHSLFREDILAGRGTPRVTRGWERMEISLREMARLGKEHHFRSLVVAFPLLPSLEHDYPASSYPSRLLALAGEAGLPARDLTPVYRSVFTGHESLYVPYDADHPNARGHDLAAAEIAGALLDASAAGTPAVDDDSIR
jgi:lysophospholipase L1-like esterase